MEIPGFGNSAEISASFPGVLNAHHMTALLIIFAKEPRPGQAKTRLAPLLSPTAAAQLYHSFLKDILEEMSRVPDVRLALAFSPPEAQDFFQTLAPPGTGPLSPGGA